MVLISYSLHKISSPLDFYVILMFQQNLELITGDCNRLRVRLFSIYEKRLRLYLVFVSGITNPSKFMFHYDYIYIKIINFLFDYDGEIT